MIPINVFSDPSILDMARAHTEGQGAGPRRPNPYVVDGQAVSPLLGWAWDLGRQLSDYLRAIREQENAATLRALREAVESQSRWPFRRGAGGAV